MTEFKVGDVVDIEIKGAKVTTTDARWVNVMADGRVYNLLDPSNQVTITRRAPEVKAGDVWRLIDGQVVQVGQYNNGEGLFANYVTDAEDGFEVPTGGLQGAELLFRLDGTPEPPKMLRRFTDINGNTWLQRGAELDRYSVDGKPIPVNLCLNYAKVHGVYGPLTELDPIPETEK